VLYSLCAVDRKKKESPFLEEIFAGIETTQIYAVT
jgi:hypothetical protein